MKTIYLHMGVHRSGSTALQDYLIANGQILESAGYGLILPHHDKSQLLKPLSHFKKTAFGPMSSFWRHLVRKKITNQPFSKQLISDENMMGVMPGRGQSLVNPYAGFSQFLKNIAPLQSSFHIRPRLIIRRQDQWIESLYAFQLFKGCTVTFHDFISRFNHRHLDWNRYLHDLQAFDLLNHSHLMTADYCRLHPHESWVTNLFDLPENKLKQQQTATNERLQVRNMQLFLALNRIGWAKDNRLKRKKLRRQMTRLSHIYGDQPLANLKIDHYLAEAGLTFKKAQLDQIISHIRPPSEMRFYGDHRIKWMAPLNDANKKLLDQPMVTSLPDTWQKL